MAKILITGGLGYIGSHIAYLLKENAVIIDSQINSSLNYVKHLPLARVYVNEIEKNVLRKIFKENDIKGVIHLAGLKSVNDSVNLPLIYYKSNITPMMDLLETMNLFKINNLIFSSSATVYGNDYKSPLREDFKPNSVNPYGSTKIIIEQMIKDYCMSHKKLRAISLRYFNPIGSNYKAGLVDQPLGTPHNIMPILIQSILKNKIFKIFGDDYSTIDGTCVRDYIHVSDLSSAHIRALKYLPKVKEYTAFNIGLGKGISVLEFIKCFEKTNNIKIRYKVGPRRPGDADISFADNSKAKQILGWRPQFKHADMMRDAWLSTKNYMDKKQKGSK